MKSSKARQESAIIRRIKDFERYNKTPGEERKRDIAGRDIYQTAVHLGIQHQYSNYEKYKVVTVQPKPQHDMTPLSTIEAREQMMQDLINDDMI